ncbi:MAG: hypothetical protein IT430_18145 [Phycisphaerales bacterium]|nr:hypothetical protein [Phycisphaerales bacterium]
MKHFIIAGAMLLVLSACTKPIEVDWNPQDEPPIDAPDEPDARAATWPEAWYVRCDAHAGRRCGGPYRTQQMAEDVARAHNCGYHWCVGLARVTPINCWH